MKLEDFENFKHIMTALYSKYPQNPEIVFTLASAYQKQLDFSESLKLYERSYELGKNESIHNIIDLLFQRIGTCEYMTCSDNCCKSMLLKHANGAPVIDKIDLERLIANDKRNKCWIQTGETNKRQAIYNCTNFKTDQSCADYKNRPQICIDYPLSLLNKRKTCTYQFALNNNTPKFNSSQTLSVVLQILEKAGYKNEVETLISLNQHLFKTE
ncbi:hypothetical protein OAO55_01480 [Bacteroidales bacterium]|nr:hypothetical protein [Bacteroidales bacterium]